MRRRLLAGLTGLFFLMVVTGCGSDNTVETPRKTLEVPKGGPVPAGGGGSKTKGAAVD